MACARFIVQADCYPDPAAHFAADVGDGFVSSALSSPGSNISIRADTWFIIFLFFVGILIELPAAFLLAFGARNRVLASLALVALGVGSGMILDEMTYLVVTQASDQDYVSRVSLGGAIGFVSLAAILLVGIYWARRD